MYYLGKYLIRCKKTGSNKDFGVTADSKLYFDLSTPESEYKSPVSSIEATTRNTNATTLNDREIAISYLLTLKRAGREYAWSVMEASNPDLREFLKDTFTMSCNHAYEVWQWMVKKGYHPLCPVPQEELTKIGNIYNEVTNQ